jgi:hypothetical protein
MGSSLSENATRPLFRGHPLTPFPDRQRLVGKGAPPSRSGLGFVKANVGYEQSKVWCHPLPRERARDRHLK